MAASAERNEALHFTTSFVNEIEQGLEQARPGGWRRLRAREESAFSRFGMVAAWWVEVPKGWHLHPLINHVVVGINGAFPLSDPIVVALQGIGKDAPAWPHVDPSGNVCLRRLQYSSPAAIRVLTMLEDALSVFAMPQDQRDIEHRLEFLAYWARSSTVSRMPYLCVLSGAKHSRDIVYSGNADRGLVFAEDAASLNTWLKRSGTKPPAVSPATRLIWLDEPLTPEEFPRVGADVITLAGEHVLDPHVRAGSVLPVLLGCVIEGTEVYACVEIEGISARQAAKGFRPSKARPAALVAPTFQGKPTVRRMVQRADYAWVHGRGRNAEIEELRYKRVVVVGCGALGGFLARALAQAGVGSLLLIDGDEFGTCNVGRHLLGMEFVGLPKSVALAKKLEADFPHAVKFDAWTGAIQAATQEQLQELAGCNLIIAAGITLAGERALNDMRQHWDTPPPMVWTWIEELAVAGHAVAIVDGASLTDALDAEGGFGMRLTADWPADRAHALEAGCGVAYQPYSASDMTGTINCAARLSLDVLLGKVSENVVCSWMGNRELAVASGCTVAEAFDRSFAEISREWLW